MEITKFNFFVPIDLKKGENGTEYTVEGLASDGTRDSDNETLKEATFDTSELSYFNWDHQKGPENVIGAVTDWDAKKGYLFVKGKLFADTERGRSTIALMTALQKTPKAKKLGMSIEGQVLERDVMDRTKIKKAKVTSIALCPFPKNSNTWAELVKKSFTGEDTYKPTEKREHLAAFKTAEGVTVTLNRDCELKFVGEEDLLKGTNEITLERACTMHAAEKISTDALKKIAKVCI